MSIQDVDGGTKSAVYAGRIGDQSDTLAGEQVKSALLQYLNTWFNLTFCILYPQSQQYRQTETGTSGDLYHEG
jgi:hypothetical protein